MGKCGVVRKQDLLKIKSLLMQLIEELDGIIKDIEEMEEDDDKKVCSAP